MNPIPLLTLPGIKGKQSHLMAKMQLKLWIIISKNVRTLIIEDYYYVFFNTLVSYCLRTIRESLARYTFQISGLHCHNRMFILIIWTINILLEIFVSWSRNRETYDEILNVNFRIQPNIYIHTYRQTYTHIYIYIYVCVCTYTCIYIYIHTYIHSHMYIYIYMYMCVCMYIYMYTYICMYMYIYVYVYVYVSIAYYCLLFFQYFLMYFFINILLYF